MKKIKSSVIIFICIFTVVISAVPVSAAGKKMSKSEKDAYSRVLWYKQYIEDSEHMIYSQGSYFLYDINNDGNKELIVSGPLELRNVYYTMIYSYNNKKLYKKCIRGEVVEVSSKGIAVCESDYSCSDNYEYTYIYKVDKKCNVTCKFYNKIYEDLATGTGTSKYYNASGKEITKAQYNKLYKKYKFKNVYNKIKPKSGNLRSGIIKTFNNNISTKLSNGEYYTNCSGDNIDEVYELTPYIYKAKIEKNKLCLYGNFRSADNMTDLKDVGIYKIPIASSCKFWEVGGDFADIKHDLSYFNKIAEQPEYLGEFYFTVKNGKIVKITWPN